MNSTNNTTAHSRYTITTKIVLVSAYAIIFTIALFGNSIGLYVVCAKANSRRITNLLIKNLAVADLIFTVTVMPYSVLLMFFEGNLWFGGTMGVITCKVIFYAIPVSIAASVTTMTVISLDRFCAIFFPLNLALFHKHKTITAVIWLISLISMTPYLFIYQVFKEGEQYFCYQDWPWSDNLQETFFALRTFHVILFVLLYPLPLLIITVVNCLVGHRLWLHRTPGSISSANRTTLEVSRRKVIKMLVVLVVVFALCWLPTHVNHYFIFFQPDVWYNMPIVVAHLMFWVSHANSAINPMLYIALNRNFRYAFLDATGALFTSPVRAISACMTYIRGEQPTPELHFTNERPVRPRQHSAFRVAPAVVGGGDNARRGHETKL